MVKPALNPQKCLLLLTVLYLSTRYLRLHVDGLPSFIAFHFTDLLFIPMQLTICLIVLRFLKRNNTLTIPVALAFVNTMSMSVLFEWYLPIYKGSVLQTADITDALMYFLGAVLFLLMQRKWFSIH